MRRKYFRMIISTIPFLVLTSLTSSENQKFVFKDIVEDQFKYYHDMYSALSSPYLRLLEDTVSKRSMFVYKYLNGHLLSLAQKNLSLQATKRILKYALQGLAALHDQDIVHTGKSRLFYSPFIQCLMRCRYKAE